LAPCYGAGDKPVGRVASSVGGVYQTPVRKFSSIASGAVMLFVLINTLVIIVVGAILFYLIDRFVRDGRLANLLKILVGLICLLAILQRLLPALGIDLF
jgi:hypothetical protein